ncbi:uncharacterized protein B0H64DRAFT_395173 [Chaetomium fimeti]|uniref:EKC/KEOPS complex subunit BUD32 n=1 Tax=Chaetomium fimeti TaxID=1854472 RepID=A0AAE0LS25_9PEZI|nr:hypothetical protein B0H64DRAFT_395173 [Chaetomium fimeti]
MTSSNLAIISTALSDSTLQGLRDEFEDRVFRGVDGFFAKYFDKKPWAPLVAAAAAGSGFPHLDAVMKQVQSLVPTLRSDTAGIHFRSEPLNKPGDPLSAAIYLLTGQQAHHIAPSNIRVCGQSYHATTNDHNDTHILRLYHQATQVFKAQPTRYFLHGFLVNGSTLELWVFDRSGAYSSETFDLRQRPNLLLQILCGYACMSDEEAGLNSFVKRCEANKTTYVEFDDQEDNRFYLGPDWIAAPSYLVGLGTACLGASRSASTAVVDPDAVVKFSWREDDATHPELQLLELARKRNVKGIIQVLGNQDLVSIAHLRSGLQFPQPLVNRTLSCVVTSPRGWPIQKFASIPELLHALGDLVEALGSLYLDGGIIHRDVAIKNLIIAPQPGAGRRKGVLIDFDLALDVENARALEPMMGSEGFMAIGILSGQKHTYRHDLESLFYVLLWLAIGNNHEADDASGIMQGLPEGSRLRKWCGMDFGAIRRDKAADMSPEGFVAMLDEFSPDFAPVQDLTRELHALLFPLHDGRIFTGTEMDRAAAKRLYDGMAAAFHKSASSFPM